MLNKILYKLCDGNEYDIKKAKRGVNTLLLAYSLGLLLGSTGGFEGIGVALVFETILTIILLFVYAIFQFAD